jgi:hypothetical protein
VIILDCNTGRHGDGARIGLVSDGYGDICNDPRQEVSSKLTAGWIENTCEDLISPYGQN